MEQVPKRSVNLSLTHDDAWDERAVYRARVRVHRVASRSNEPILSQKIAMITSYLLIWFAQFLLEFSFWQTLDIGRSFLHTTSNILSSKKEGRGRDVSFSFLCVVEYWVG